MQTNTLDVPLGREKGHAILYNVLWSIARLYSPFSTQKIKKRQFNRENKLTRLRWSCRAVSWFTARWLAGCPHSNRRRVPRQGPQSPRRPAAGFRTSADKERGREHVLSRSSLLFLPGTCSFKVWKISWPRPSTSLKEPVVLKQSEGIARVTLLCVVNHVMSSPLRGAGPELQDLYDYTDRWAECPLSHRKGDARGVVIENTCGRKVDPTPRTTTGFAFPKAGATDQLGKKAAAFEKVIFRG